VERRTAAVATLAITLAGVVIWQSIGMVADRDAAASKFRLAAWLSPSGARFVVVAVAALGVGAGLAMAARRTRPAGAAAATAGLLAVTGYLVVVWAVGEPVQCLCTSSGRGRGWVPHLTTIVVAGAGAAVAGFVAWASRRREEDPDPR
jgi:Methylamine utilisation protein MauE